MARDPLERIADALEDFLEITLSAQEAATYAASDPEAEPILRPVVDALERIRARRALRGGDDG